MECKRFLSFLLAVVMIFGMLPVMGVSAAEEEGSDVSSPESVETEATEVAEVPSGTCGANLTWTLVDGLLTITGDGGMDNYEWNGAPWAAYAGEITEIILPDKLENIGSNAFMNCTSLSSVQIPDPVLVIGDGAFTFCTNLQTVKLPELLVEIGSRAFMGCNLSEIYIFEHLSDIGANAFLYNNNMTAITVAEGNIQFSDIDGVLYNDGITSLLHYPAGKEDAELVIPDTVLEVCFISGAMNLESVTIPASVESLGDSTFFENCDNMKQVVVEEGNAYYRSQDGVLYTADMHTLLYYPAGKEDAAFQMPYGVEEFRAQAFRSARNLVSVALPGSLRSIGWYAFNFCSNLQSITIPVSVTEFDSRIFNCCSQLTEILYGGTEEQWNAIEKAEDWNIVDWDGNEGQFTITYNALCAEDHTWLEGTCTEPKTCTVCGLTEEDPAGHTGDPGTNCAVCGQFISVYGTCGENLTWTFNEGVLTISGEGEMDSICPWDAYRESIVTVVLEEGITSIANYAFAGFSNMTSISIPEGVTVIGNNAFMECMALETVNLPSTLISIGTSAFRSCKNLTAISIPEGVTTVSDYAFCGCSCLM